MTARRSSWSRPSGSAMTSSPDWRRFPLAAARRRSARPSRAACPSSSTRDSARARFPVERRPRRADRIGAAARRAIARSARSASASSAATSSTTPSARSRSRSASSARTRSSAPACTTPSGAGAAALGLLAAIGEHLARSLEPDAALRTLADLVVPTLADQCVVDLVSGRGACAGSSSSTRIRRCSEAARVMERYPPGARERHAGRGRDPHGRAAARRLGTEELPDTAYRSAEHRVACRRVGHPHDARRCPCSCAGARSARSRSAGRRRDAARTTTSTQLAAQIARRVALALDNSALYQEAHGERERLAALVRQLPLGVIIAETASRKLLFTNQRAQELLGHRRLRALDRRTARRAHPPGARGRVDVRPARSTCIRADGSRGIVSLSAEPVRDAGGEIVAAVATLFDLTEHRQREEALAFLAEASVVLSETLDLQHTLTELVELAVPRLADWCTIDMLDHGEIRNVGVAHADPDTARLARRLHARRPVQGAGLERRLGGAQHGPLAADPGRPRLAGASRRRPTRSCSRCRACSACARRSSRRSPAAAASSAR